MDGGTSDESGFARELYGRASEALVGRETELAALDEMLETAGERPVITCLLGEPGIGKSALASLFRLGAQARGHRVVWISGEGLDPNRSSVVSALEERGLTFETLGRADLPDVVVFDAFERVAEIARWLFTESIPRAGRRLAVMITSRQRLDPTVRGDAAVAPILVERFLAPLDPQDSARLLTQRGVPEGRVAEIHAASGGLPLALTLAAEQHTRSSEGRPSTVRDNVAELAVAFLRDTRSDAERRALYALSHVRSLDEGLLGAMLGEAPGGLYDFLRGLSFVSEEREGLAAHALVNDALHLDHHTRDPDGATAMVVRAARELISRVRKDDLIQHRRRLMDSLYAMRELGSLRQLEMRAVATSYLEQVDVDNVSEAMHWVAHHEGDASAALLATVMELGLYHGFIVRHSADGSFAGMTGHVDLQKTPEHVVASDPMLCAGALVAEELEGSLGVFRWFFARDTYTEFGPQMAPMMFAGPVVSWSAPEPMRHLMFAPRPIEMWEPIAPPFQMRSMGPVFEMDGPRQAFVRVLATREGQDAMEGLVATTLEVALLWAGRQLDPEAEFTPRMGAEEVREALAVLRSPAELADVALAQFTPGLAARPPGERSQALDQQLRAAITALAEHDGYREYADVLTATYINGAAKQRAAAAELGMPYGTYRHRLRRAVELLTLELRGDLSP